MIAHSLIFAETATIMQLVENILTILDQDESKFVVRVFQCIRRASLSTSTKNKSESNKY